MSSNGNGAGEGPRTIPINRPSQGEGPSTVETEAESEGEGEHFDAVAAAEELTRSLGADPSQMARDQRDSYVDTLEKEVERLEKLVEEKDQLARRTAVEARDAREEVDRARSRIEKESARDLETRRRKILLGFVEVMDDVDRAIAAARELDHNPAVLDGMELMRKRFLKELAENGVRHNPSMGETFDPNQHEAMSAVPVTDPSQDGVVVGVISEGYNIGDTPLRPARVAVGKLSS